jgi:hypothetical protein
VVKDVAARKTGILKSFSTHSIHMINKTNILCFLILFYRCLKKYCDCYNIGAKCDEDKCRCVDCENYPSDDDDCDEASISSSLDDNEQDVSDHDAYDSATSFQEDEDEKSEIFALPKAESAIDNKALAAV